jgi:murein DD-endopeptidase MepM/ murein hydrolase activator NlpD
MRVRLSVPPIRRTSWIAAILVVALSLGGLLIVPNAQAQSSCAYLYTVKRGDNLYRIALAAGTTYQALARMNHIANPNLILVGQVLCLPAPIPTSTTPTPVPSTSTMTDPCLTTQLLTVKVNSYIYFSPDEGSRTNKKLRRGSRFFVCTNTTLNGWVAFKLDGIAPLYVRVGVFG